MGFRGWFEVALVVLALVGWRRELDLFWNTVAPRLGAYIETFFRKKPS